MGQHPKKKMTNSYLTKNIIRAKTQNNTFNASKPNLNKALTSVYLAKSDGQRINPDHYSAVFGQCFLNTMSSKTNFLIFTLFKMGTIKQGILGGFSGKVGTVVGGSWKGISYMRSLAQNVKNPRTEAQMTQRSKFALTLAFLKPITNYVRVGFKPYASKQTAFNATMSYIVANAISANIRPHVGFRQGSRLGGSLFPVDNASAEVDAGKVTISWTDNSECSDTLATDAQCR